MGEQPWPLSSAPASRVASGLATYEKLRGPQRAKAMRSAIDSGTTGAALTALSMDFVFGQVWSRDGLQPSQRSLVTMAVLLALRQTAELKNHIRIGLTNGLTPQEVEEAFIQAAAYAGFPAARVATDLLGEILRESDRSFDGDAHERR